MSNEENKAKLVDKKNDLIKQQAHMEVLRNPIVKYISLILKSSLDNQIKEIVVDKQASFSSSLGSDRIAKLRDETKGYIDSIDTLVERAFANDSLWFHKREIQLYVSPNERHIINEQTTHINKGITPIIQKVIQLLESYGYSYVSQYISCYIHGDGALDGLLQNYSKEMIKLHTLMRDIQSLEHTIDSTNVAAIWGD